MKLADLRRVAIQTGTRIRFSLPGGLECVVNEHGVAQVPEWNGAPAFNLEEELARAPEFTLEAVLFPGKTRGRSENSTRVVSREQLAALAGTKAPQSASDEHEE